jgi:ribosomal protein S12 methylthiotransferase accessory factor
VPSQALRSNPSDIASRPEADAKALEWARAAAAACGVTRLADITGLDRIGVPVFQAIRPASRALAVHQGKGLTVLGAQVGALMEAVESAHAEAFDGRSETTAYDDLPPDERASDLTDFARMREDGVGRSEAIAWTRAERLVDGRAVQAPLDCVSLDCSRPWDRRLDHTSTGLASRFDFEGAVLKGLLEVLERDAAVAWRSLPDALRSAESIDHQTIGYPWFREIAERLRRAQISLTLYNTPTVIGLPSVRAELVERGSDRHSRVATAGWGCAPAWEEALRAAVLEGLQSRLTAISGVRDDILYKEQGETSWSGDASPLPPDLDPLDWEELATNGDDTPDLTPWRVAEMLAAAGFPDGAVVRVSPPESRVCVVKVFVPGLGANLRTRRPPVWRRAG